LVLWHFGGFVLPAFDFGRKILTCTSIESTGEPPPDLAHSGLGDMNAFFVFQLCNNTAVVVGLIGITQQIAYPSLSLSSA
jgi:hypothetical protein